jgi:hypothetical protein
MSKDNKGFLDTHFNNNDGILRDLNYEQASQILKGWSERFLVVYRTPRVWLLFAISMSPFTPRPFPPLSLGDVPIEYITQQLHALAPQYWDKPETADCTISTSYFSFPSLSLLTPSTSCPYSSSRPFLNTF